MAEQLKYRITELLDKMPHAKSIEVFEKIPKVCNISKRTFKTYRLRKVSDSTQMPSEVLIKMAKLLEVEPEQLFNQPLEI